MLTRCKNACGRNIPKDLNSFLQKNKQVSEVTVKDVYEHVMLESRMNNLCRTLSNLIPSIRLQCRLQSIDYALFSELLDQLANVLQCTIVVIHYNCKWRTTNVHHHQHYQ